MNLEEILRATPPSEMTHGHTVATERVRRRALSFGSLTKTSRKSPIERRPAIVDKRTRPEPEPANIPVRVGGTVML